MKYIISGGGTGGHIYPALAVAEALKQQDSQAEFLFVGAKGKMEMQKVPQAGYAIEGLWISGLDRKNIKANLLFPLKLVNSLWKAYTILRRFKPDVVVGFGGYASGAVLYVAQQLGIPTLIQEQNSYAGLTNKWLAKRAKAICVAYPNMQHFFPQEKIKLTGNPVRKDILQAEAKRAEAYDFFQLKPAYPTLLVIGGSLGAKSINQALAQGLDLIKQAGIQILWQTGKTYWAEKQAFIKENDAKNGVRMVEFIQRMDLAYAIADAVISRAGALAIAEICLVAKPTIFVPFPYAAEDHQTKNVQALIAYNAAWCLPDAQASEQLVTKILSLLSPQNAQERLKLSQNIQHFAYPQAAEHIASEVIQVAQQRKKAN